MTARQCYEAALIEMNKFQAPSLILEEFNYMFNKTIRQFMNKKYNIYDVNQQTTDDLRVLKSTCTLKPTKTTLYGINNDSVTASDSLYGATYEADLPLDYFHLLNCICTFKVNKQFKCYNKDTYVQFAATRLTADLWAKVINNLYMRPSYKRPYYYINNVNSNNSGSLPTNPYNPNDIHSTGMGPGTDISILSIRDKWNSYILSLQNYIVTKITDVYNDAQVIDETFIPLKTPYYRATNKTTGENYCIIYNYSTNEFELVPEATAELSIAEETIIVITNSNKIKVVDDTLYIDNKEALTYYILVSDSFLSTYGDKASLGGLPRTLKTDVGEISLVERDAIHRYGNPSNVRLEIRYGKDDSLFQLVNVYVDYIKTPQEIRLTQEQLDLTEDTSQIMEYPDYICQEIINELVNLLMENSSDPRLQTHIPVNQSIASPAQQQAQPSK